MFLSYYRQLKTPTTGQLILADRWTMLEMLFLVRTSLGIQFQSIASFSPFLIADMASGYTEIGTVISLFMLLGALIALPGGLPGKRYGDRRVCAFGLALMVLGGILVGVSRSYETVLAGRLLCGIAQFCLRFCSCGPGCLAGRVSGEGGTLGPFIPNAS